MNAKQEVLPTDEVTKSLAAPERGPTALEQKWAAARELEKPQVVDDQLTSLVQALAQNPNVDVDKLERIIGMQKSMLSERYEGLFNTALSEAQADMRVVVTNRENQATHSKYASYSAIDRVIRPVYTQHGFSLSFNTGDIEGDFVRVICYVAHRSGFRRTYHVDMPADGKGAKGGDVMTKTHAVGSALTYGQRYLLKLIFNVAIGNEGEEEDDDGNAAGGQAADQPPDGYHDWLEDLQSVADNGRPELADAWRKAPKVYCEFLTKHALESWELLKRKAGKVTADREAAAAATKKRGEATP